MTTGLPSTMFVLNQVNEYLPRPAITLQRQESAVNLVSTGVADESASIPRSAKLASALNCSLLDIALRNLSVLSKEPLDSISIITELLSTKTLDYFHFDRLN